MAVAEPEDDKPNLPAMDLPQTSIPTDEMEPITLTMEQQFSLRSFETQVERMSREQAQDFLLKLYEQMILRETMYRHFLKRQWGIDK